jgi:hypothetical protein
MKFKCATYFHSRGVTSNTDNQEISVNEHLERKVVYVLRLSELVYDSQKGRRPECYEGP